MFRLVMIVILVVVSALVRPHHRSDFSSAAVTPTYTADFPLKDRGLIERGTDLYYFHDAVGEVTVVGVAGDRLRVRFQVNEEFLPQWRQMRPTLNLYRARKDYTSAWIAVIPTGSDGRKMTPSEAARVFGTGS